MAVRNGRYRHKVTIQQPTETVDAAGQAVKSWSTFAQPYASIEPLRGREYFSAERFESEITVRIRLQYLSGVTSKMRVSFDSRTYNIESVIDPMERGREMQLMCSQGLNDG